MRVEGQGKRYFSERFQRALVIQEMRVEELKNRERERLATAKLEAERAEAGEMAALEELFAEIEEPKGRRNFEEVIRILEATKFESEAAIQGVGDELRIYRAASAFTDTLIGDLNRYGYSGVIGRVGAPEINGTISSASRSEVRVQMNFGGTVGETRLDFSALSLEGLLKIARDLVGKVESMNERKERMEIIIFYSRLSGLLDYSEELGNAFALEDEEFRNFWTRLSRETGGAKEVEENQS